MSLINFFNSLNPFTKKRDILEKIRLIEESLDTTISMYAMSAELGGTELWANPPNLSGTVAGAIKSSGYGKYRVDAKNLDQFLLDHLRLASEKLVFIRDMFDRGSEGDVSKDGITYHRITAMAMVSRIAYVSTFAHRLLTVHSMGRSPAEVKWVADNIKPFATAFASVDVTTERFKEVLATLPDKSFSPDGHATDLSIDGSTKVDPLQFNLIGLSWNPFFYIGVKWAQRNINQMNADKADLKALRFRISLLKDRRNGVEDAALEKELAVYEADAVALAEDIAKTERRYGFHQ